MEPKRVLIIGVGGNATVISFAMSDAFYEGKEDYKFIGYINDKPGEGIEESEGYPVIGGLKDIPRLIDENYYFINAADKTGLQKDRMSLIEQLNIPDHHWVTFIHPMAYVSPMVKLGPGCIVMPNAIIQPGTTLGKCCTVMFGALVGHDGNVGNFCFFDSGSISGAYLKIGDAVHVGTNATIRELLTIKNYSKVGMGAVLLKNVEEGEVWVGNPAKLFRNTQ
jgi:acetyltransferase EpsM